MARRVRMLGLVVGLVIALAGCDWPMFRFDPGHTGFNQSEILLDKSNVGSLHPVWFGMTGALVESSPAVANGVAYIGSEDHKLYAFDAAGTTGCSGTPGPLKTCAPLWTGATGDRITSSPAVANGVVYVGSYDGKVYAFDAAGANCGGSPKTCSPLWVAPTGGLVASSPTVVGGVVYIGSTDEKLYALRASDGIRLWSAALGGVVVSSPAVVNGVVYVGSVDHRLWAFDAAGVKGCGGSPTNCQPLWTGSTGGEIVSSPAVAGGVVYIGSNDNKLYAFDASGRKRCSGTPKTCTPLWTGTTGERVGSSPAVANGVVYVGSFDGKLYAFDATGRTGCSHAPKTCAPLWTSDTTGNIQLSSPAVANGIVYVNSYVMGSGRTFAFDAAGSTGCSGSPKTCAPLVTLFTNDFGISSPTVVNGRVYVASGTTLRVFAP
jgi:outer membrane protein assembly factor BamB